jgi:hypothetical protein
MRKISRQIGWSNESNLLYQILNQIIKLTSVVFALKPKYKVFTALLTQSGADNPLSLNSGAVTKGVTYRIDGGNDGDFSNVGAPSNDDSTSFIAINDEVPNSYGTCSLLYNTATPTVKVLENTLGNLWFEYESVGIYRVDSNNLFTNNKTVVFGGFSNLSLDVFFYIPDGEITINNIKLFTGDPLFSDNYLNNTPIEIRVYN